MKVLVDFGANPNLESRPRSGGEPTTAYECGLNHSHDRVRALFSDCAGDSLRNALKHKPGSLRVGRTWMQSSLSKMIEKERDVPSPTESINIERIFKSSRGTRTCVQPDTLDPSFFPLLNSVNQPQISGPRMHVSEGPWSPSNIDNLIASFSVDDEPDAPPIAEQSAHVDPFPRLNSHISKNPLETEAGKLWADLRKPKGHPVAEDAFSRSASSEKNPLSGKKGTKKHGKSRWQPLTI